MFKVEWKFQVLTELLMSHRSESFILLRGITNASRYILAFSFLIILNYKFYFNIQVITFVFFR